MVVMWIHTKMLMIQLTTIFKMLFSFPEDQTNAPPGVVKDVLARLEAGDLYHWHSAAQVVEKSNVLCAVIESDPDYLREWEASTWGDVLKLHWDHKWCHRFGISSFKSGRADYFDSLRVAGHHMIHRLSARRDAQFFVRRLAVRHFNAHGGSHFLSNWHLYENLLDAHGGSHFLSARHFYDQRFGSHRLHMLNIRLYYKASCLRRGSAPVEDWISLLILHKIHTALIFELLRKHLDIWICVLQEIRGAGEPVAKKQKVDA
jgi:hypothetical protein